MGRIIVGVDGSAGADGALAWAAEEARLRAAELEVLYAYMVPMTGELPLGAEAEAELEAEAHAALDATVGRADLEGVAVDPRVAHGPAAALLVDAARGAELLVVGSRGRGGFAGLLLGSVSQQCAHHATCPIVIVPDGRERGGSARAHDTGR